MLYTYSELKKIFSEKVEGFGDTLYVLEELGIKEEESCYWLCSEGDGEEYDKYNYLEAILRDNEAEKEWGGIGDEYYYLLKLDKEDIAVIRDIPGMEVVGDPFRVVRINIPGMEDFVIIWK